METVQEIEDKLNNLGEEIIENRNIIDRINAEISLYLSPKLKHITFSDSVPVKLKIDRSLALLGKIDEALAKDENTIEARANLNTLIKFLEVEKKSHEEINYELQIPSKFHHLSTGLLLKEVSSRVQLAEIRKNPSKMNYFVTFIFAALLGIGASYLINYIYRLIFK
ncbi:unnamed protein product [Blepharisma stoltei]|uniref:Tyrosine kinase G-rich domain-containing protein n=1 Tax=Blepharisma stoltei TaxID=1481888 RepID=A0AAU9JYJ2_9CILI|nr:unnamed protein product [Blepharisma stoltei]